MALLNSHWKSEIDRELEALEREGLSIRTESLQPASTPDVTAACVRVMAAAKETNELPTAVRLMFGTGAEKLQTALRDPQSDECLYLFQPEPEDPSCPEDLQSAAALLISQVDKIEGAIDAALAGGARFRGDLTPGAKHPHLSAVVDLIGAFRFRSSWRALHGDVDGAWADVERALGLTEMLDDPMLWTWIFRRTMFERCWAMIEELLFVAPPPSDEPWSRIDAALARFEQPGRGLVALRDTLRELLAWDSAGLVEALAAKETGWRAHSLRLQGRLLAERWRLDFVRHASVGIRVMAADSSATVKRQDQLQVIDDRAATATLFVREFNAELVPMNRNESESIARARLARAGLRLARLAEVPESVELPQDGCDPSGGSLRWKRIGPREGLLWSVGRDQQDNGGNNPPDVFDWVDGTDCVFRVVLR